MLISEQYPSRFLKAPDPKGRATSVKIMSVETEDLGQGEKPVMYFEGKQKALVLNKSNATTIARAHGDDTDGWRGKTVILRPTTVDVRGVPTPSIRVEIPGRLAANLRVPGPDETPPVPNAMPDGPAALDDVIPF
jgi:hypothetical protein